MALRTGGIGGGRMRVIASNNPMGIEINLGFYALCEAILTGKCCGEVLKNGVALSLHGMEKASRKS